jgi:hypothetical protein
MYLHCKRGFVEADRWDGSPIPDPVQQKAVQRLRRGRLADFIAGGREVIVARSRERETLEQLLGDVRIKRRQVFETLTWDYPFRVYLAVDEWARVLAGVALELDYRNFKHWTTDHRPDQHQLAYRIWQVAFDAARR